MLSAYYKFNKKIKSHVCNYFYLLPVVITTDT